jgi:hypothetical protein
MRAVLGIAVLLAVAAGIIWAKPDLAVQHLGFDPLVEARSLYAGDSAATPSVRDNQVRRGAAGNARPADPWRDFPASTAAFDPGAFARLPKAIADSFKFVAEGSEWPREYPRRIIVFISYGTETFPSLARADRGVSAASWLDVVVQPNRSDADSVIATTLKSCSSSAGLLAEVRMAERATSLRDIFQASDSDLFVAVEYWFAPGRTVDNNEPLIFLEAEYTLFNKDLRVMAAGQSKRIRGGFTSKSSVGDLHNVVATALKDTLMEGPVGLLQAAYLSGAIAQDLSGLTARQVEFREVGKSHSNGANPTIIVSNRTHDPALIVSRDPPVRLAVAAGFKLEFASLVPGRNVLGVRHKNGSFLVEKSFEAGRVYELRIP